MSYLANYCHCDGRIKVTCPHCDCEYTQLVCRDCGGEHIPLNYHNKDTKKGKELKKSNSQQIVCCSDVPRG